MVYKNIKIYKIAWYLILKTGQKVLLFNYCSKNYGGSLLVKKIVKKGITRMEVWA